jgi:hypothetical protein
MRNGLTLPSVDAQAPAPSSAESITFEVSSIKPNKRNDPRQGARSDDFAERQCAGFYDARMGHPGVYAGIPYQVFGERAERWTSTDRFQGNVGDAW